MKNIITTIFGIIGFFTIVTSFSDNGDINEKGKEGTYQFVIRNAVDNNDFPGFYVFDTRNGDIYMTFIEDGTLTDYSLMLGSNLE